MQTWITDDNGNRCSVEYFGSEEAARAALASLKDCKNCVNCSDCSYCSGCSGCWGCSGCSGCSYCSYCSYCSGCSGCSRCSGRESKTEPALAVPSIPNIHRAVYEVASAPQALDMSSWHTCDTTHCRAGWVVTLAGAAGKALESFHDTPLAAMLIYKASGYEINPAQFYRPNAEALADMKRLADEEAAQ